MLYIHFECPKCKQTLYAPEELSAQFIECPTCKETIEVPLRSLLPKQELPPPLPPQLPQVKIPEPAASQTQSVIIQSQPVSVTLRSQPIHVVVKNFDMEFGSMVIFMIKMAIASIPSGLILFILFKMFGAFP